MKIIGTRNMYVLYLEQYLRKTQEIYRESQTLTYLVSVRCNLLLFPCHVARNAHHVAYNISATF
jgi:hypothetical protein